MQVEPPTARFSNGERRSGGPVIAVLRPLVTHVSIQFETRRLEFANGSTRGRRRTMGERLHPSHACCLSEVILSNQQVTLLSDPR